MSEKRTLLGRVLDSFASRREVVSAPNTKRSTVSYQLFGDEWGPQGNKSRNADAASSNSVVARSVALIASTLAAVPVHVYRGETKVEGGPLVDLLTNPNELEAWPRFCRALVNMQLVDGQSFALLSEMKNSRRLPVSMIPLSSADVEPIRPEDAPYDLRGWEVEGHGTVEPERVVRFEYYPDPADPLGSISPLTAAEMDVESDEFAAQFNRNALESGGAVAGVLQWQNPDVRLGQDDLQRAAEAFERKYSGTNNANSTAVLTGDWNYTNLGNSSRDLEYIAGREFVARRLAMIYGVPPQLIGDTSNTGLSAAGLDDARRQLYEQSIIPIARNMEAVLTKALCSDPRECIKFDFSQVEALREDYTEKLTHAAELVKVGYPLNVVNETVGLGMPEVKHGDEHLVNAGLVPASAITGDAGASAEDPSEALPGPEELLDEKQTAILLSLVEKVQSGALPRDSAKAMLEKLLHLTPEQAEEFLGSAGIQPEPVAGPVAEPETEEEDESARGGGAHPARPTSTPTRKSEAALIKRVRLMR